MRWGPGKLAISTGPTRNDASAVGGRSRADDHHQDDEEQENRNDERDLDDRADLRSRARALHIRHHVHRGAQDLGFLDLLVGLEPHATGKQEVADQETHEGEHAGRRRVRTDPLNLGVEGVNGLAVGRLGLTVGLLLTVSLLGLFLAGGGVGSRDRS